MIACFGEEARLEANRRTSPSPRTRKATDQEKGTAWVHTFSDGVALKEGPKLTKSWV